MQAIIRFSLQHDQNGRLWNRLQRVLQDAGFVRRANTATHRHPDISATDLAVALQQFWETVAGVPETRMDHFWMYSEEAFPEEVDVMAAPA
ncbi:hypothetical protein [Paracoccus hibiscisoli]|uniref:Uncharacterized protein n=1 Tax=Paracoccus hibiscisoli TaxID=2023261 RepID=A0A4U0QJZ9_9RHOB|nr:hypothetical protein [Paracoccus hibiscisoli]TJZ82023.1 hypothetical protein FA740_15810 [Paracoccus hibiscisoli]